MKAPIRLLIADDSPTLRAALRALLSGDAAIQVVAEAGDGQEALELARSLRPDVITMDVQMPRLDGLKATELIMSEAPSRILVVCAASEGAQVDLSFRAIAAGALELIAKPATESRESLRSWGQRVAEAVRLMSEVPVITRHARGRPVEPPAGGAVLVALAASTGGPPAIANLLAQLPKDFPAAVMAAQHLAPGFAPGLARWFSAQSPLPVVVVDRRQRCQPGTVYLPPEGQELVVDADGSVQARPAAGVYCPSADALLESVAAAYGGRAVAVVLTGMGSDGTAGALAVRRAGGYVLAQDQASCTVFGMPQAASQAGAVHELLPLNEIPRALVRLCSPGASRRPARTG